MSHPRDIWDLVIELLPLGDLAQFRKTCTTARKLVDEFAAGRHLKPSTQKPTEDDVEQTTERFKRGDGHAGMWVVWFHRGSWLQHLSCTGRADAMEYLIAAGAPIAPRICNCCQRSVGHPLVISSTMGHTKVVRLLLDAGVVPADCREDALGPPLESCVYNNFAEIVKMLVQASGATPRSRLPWFASLLVGILALACRGLGHC